MKIAFCLNHFLPDSVGGTEIYTYNLVKQLKLMGHEVFIIYPYIHSCVTEEFNYEGIRVLRYPDTSTLDRNLLLGKIIPNGLKEFEKIILHEKPDVIHFHELSYGTGISIFHIEKANELHFPIVITYHLASYTCYKGSLIYKAHHKCDGIISIKKCTNCIIETKSLGPLKSKILSFASLALYNLNINATSLNMPVGTALGLPFIIQKTKKDLIRISEIAYKTIALTNWYRKVLESNGVPSEKLIYIKQGLAGNIPANKNSLNLNYPLKVIFIGRLTQLKNLHLLIEAVCQLPQNKISLYIYGPDMDFEYVNECRIKSKAHQNIFWMGTILPDDVINTLSNFHVLCLPSAFEMSPLIIQEAFAAGLPVVASAVNGNIEQIKDGINGWLFNLNENDSLFKILNNLINDFSLIENARLNLPGSNSFYNIAVEHLSVYSEIF